MPRLNHKKARTGCSRCKARKVKCDESKPQCGACSKHNVPCDYVVAPVVHRHNQTPTLITPPQDTSVRPSLSPHRSESTARSSSLDQTLELRLMHHWTCHTCKTFSTAWEFWQSQCPLIALRHRYLLDAIFAMTALHASRQPPSMWLPLEGRLAHVSESMQAPPTESWKMTDEEADAINRGILSKKRLAEEGGSNSEHLLNISRTYFDRSIEGHRAAVADLTIDNVEAIWFTSILVSFIALFTLRETTEDGSAPSVDPVLWLRLGGGIATIVRKWVALVGQEWLASAGVMYGKPDMGNDDELFNPKHGEPLIKLLTWANEFEIMDAEDQETYRKVLSFVGLALRGVIERFDEPIATCRRVAAMPSRVPVRFIELVERRQPRAMALLTYLFAAMKLLDGQVLWLEGIAEVQIPGIASQLPIGWRHLVQWPLDVAAGRIKVPDEPVQIGDLLVL